MKGAMEWFRDIVAALDSTITESEREAMAFFILEDFSISRNSVLLNMPAKIDINLLQKIISRINNGEPLQYILGYAWFYNRKFKVSPAVLIPRPETELLVDQILGFSGEDSEIVMLDLGTGSGIIPVTTSIQRPSWKIYATDISTEALEIAKQNAVESGANINWLCSDMLSMVPEVAGGVDIIVSNPPYISIQEKSTLQRQVIDFEPHLALFASDTDSLNFYRAVSRIGKQLLKPSGCILVEVNERYPQEVLKIFYEAGFSAGQVIADLDGKPRIVRVDS
jgi:release factor glutamine methyltransferase